MLEKSIVEYRKNLLFDKFEEIFSCVFISVKSHTCWRVQYKKMGLSLFHSIKTNSSYIWRRFSYIWRDTIPIHIYSFSKAIPILATFLIKAETSFKYSSYLLALLLIKEAFTCNSFTSRATLSINLFVCSIL
jgi:hypothetical protein